MCLEFSKVDNEIINLFYQQYSKIIPFLGKIITGSAGPYDYLIKMGLDTLTEERLVELNKAKDLKETEYNKIKSTSEEIMWLEDLNELSSLYKKDLKKELKEKENELKKKLKSKSKIKLKSKSKIKSKKIK